MWRFLTESAPCTVPLNADFAAAPTEGCEELTVNFTDGSTGAVTYWDWNFGDNSYSNEQNPVHTYTEPGTYTVTLIVYEGEEEDEDIEVKEDYITVTESVPTAEFSGGPLLSGTPPLIVDFTDLSTMCGNDTIDEWAWDFDSDGVIDTPTQEPTMQFNTAGYYTVSLTVTDNDGDNDIETKEDYIFVSDENPVADPGGPYSEIEGQPINFDGSGSYDPNGGTLTYAWDFNDDGVIDSTDENPGYTYPQDSEEQPGGVFTVRLTVYDEADLNGTNTATANVTDIDPVADFSADTTSGPAPLDVNFTDQTDSYDDITGWVWNFGDSSGPAMEQNPTHTYNVPGIYAVTLTVTEDDADTDVEEKVEYIEVAGECTTYYCDEDQDGYGTDDSECIYGEPSYPYTATVSGDCDDTDAAINPGAEEVCDGVDNNCNGEVDEGVTTTFYRDADGDGYGNVDDTTQACSAPEGYVEDSTDCDDSRNDVHPGAVEVCDGVDNDCDGEVDEEVTTTFYRDADSDGYGNADDTTQACSAPEGYVENSTDCDDSRNDVNPGATEVCDGVDNNCNGEVDEGVTTTFYRDADGDGYGNPDVTIQACAAPGGYVDNNTDCDDSRADVHPGAEELCDGVDNNCNGEIDEGCGCEINEIPGDLDGDCNVDFDDRSILFASMRKCVGDPGYNSDADYDGDGCVTFNDYRQWYKHWRAFLSGQPVG